MTTWEEGQREFEKQMKAEYMRDNLQIYLDEIESVREIYTEVFHLSGKILDVGGCQGRLRHYLGLDTTGYTSIDPMPFNLHALEDQPNLLKAYPCLTTRLSYSCKFITGVAEDLHLFQNDTFDWIHMRSVVDHFENPLLAFREAYRVCKPGGHLLVGMAIMEKKKTTLKSLWDSIFDPDMHIAHLTVEQLHDLYQQTGWKVAQEHWQKPPFDYCLYSCAVK